MATHSVSVLIKARDEASRKFGVIGVSSKVMGTALKATARSIRWSFTKAFAGISAAARLAFSSITSMFRRMAAFTFRWAKRAGLGFALFSGYAVKLAMDAEESENLFEVSMGGMAEATRKWSEQLSKSLGLNAYEIRRMVSTLNVMLGSMGLAPSKAAEMSKTMTKLTYDMASFYNLKTEEAFQKLQSGITGEMEPLKRLGILVNETTTKSWALKNGIIKEGQALSETQKVWARYNVILEQTKKAQGDMERTLGSTTNVFRALKDQVKLVSIEYGKILLPAVTKVADKMKKFLVENREGIILWAEKVHSCVTLVKDMFVAYINFMKQDWKDGFSKSLDAVITVFEGFGKSLTVVMKKIFMDLGANISIWIKQGLAKKAMFAKLKAEAWTELRDVTFPKTPKGGLIPLHGPTVKTISAEQKANLKKQADELARQRMSVLEEEGYFEKKHPAISGKSWAEVGKELKSISKETLEKIKVIMPDFAKDIEKALAEHKARLGALKTKPATPPGKPEPGKPEPGKEEPDTAAGDLVTALRQQLQAREARLLTTAPGARYDYAQQTARNTKQSLSRHDKLVRLQEKTVAAIDKIGRNSGTNLSPANFS